MALSPVLLLYGFYTAFMVYTGKQEGTIHLVVLHAVALNNFSPLTLDISQSQSSEFIQVPKGVGDGVNHHKLNPMDSAWLKSQTKRSLDSTAEGFSCRKIARGSFPETAKSFTCFLDKDFHSARGRATLRAPLLTLLVLVPSLC